MFKQQTAILFLQGILSFLVAGILLGLHTTAHAQIVARFQANDITFELEPRYPEAFEEVSVGLKTFAIDLDIHEITWIVNNEEYANGIGEKGISVKMGNYGQGTSVQAIIHSQDGRLVRKSINLRPATVDVLWEAIDSHVPPFYQGKALPARGAVIKFTAIPNLVIGEDHLKASDLDYTWSWNYKVKPDSSGFNKQFMGIKNLFINREEVVAVNVKNTSADIRGEGSAKVRFVDPEIAFYKTFPNSSTYDMRRSLKELRGGVNTNFEVATIPYFFSVRPNMTLDSLGFQWKVDGSILQRDNETNKNLISLIPSARGVTDLSVSVLQPEEDFQLGSGSINIISQ